MVTPLLPAHMRDVSVTRRGKRLLGPLDLTLGKTGFTILLGPNGAGKTTFLKALHGLERLSTGAVTWAVPNDLARMRQAYVFQSPVMLRRSVRANLGYPLAILGQPKAQVNKAVEAWAARIGLTPALDRPATGLSGGEKQKLALARALIRTLPASRTTSPSMVTSPSAIRLSASRREQTPVWPSHLLIRTGASPS